MLTKIRTVTLVLITACLAFARFTWASDSPTPVLPWGRQELEAAATHAEYPLGISPEDLLALPDWPRIEWQPGVPLQHALRRKAESARVFVSRRVSPEETPVTIEMLRDITTIERKVLAGGGMGNLVEGLNVHLYVYDVATALIYVDGPTDKVRAEAVQMLKDLVTRWQSLLADHIESQGLADTAVAQQVRSGTPLTAWRALSSVPLGDGSGGLKRTPLESWRFVDWSTGSPRTEKSLIGLLSRVFAYTRETESLSVVERLRRGGRSIPASTQEVSSFLSQAGISAADAPIISAGYHGDYIENLANLVAMSVGRYNR